MFKHYTGKAMKFHNIKIKQLTNILRHTPHLKQWTAKNRQAHIIGIQLRGNMYHEMTNGNITLTENCLFFFNQKDDFRAIVKELGESYTIHFTTWEPVETESFMVKIQNPEEALSILESIEHALRLQDGGENLAMSKFYRFCHLLEVHRAKGYHPKNSRITNAKAYIDLSFRENHVLDTAAECSGVSRRRFNDLFKQQYGITPNSYVTQKKIDAAKALLVDNSLTVKQVASLCGFEDLYYFCKVFKAQTGLTPTQYRSG